MNQRRSIMFNGATVEGTIVVKEGLQFFVEEVKPIDSETGMRGRKCGVCNRWYTTMAKLRKHHKVHQHPIHCFLNSCNFKAAEFKDIFRHIKANHRGILDENPKFSPIICNECGRKYSRQDHYTRHKVQGFCNPMTNVQRTPLQRIMEDSASEAGRSEGNVNKPFDAVRSATVDLSIPDGPGSAGLGEKIKELAVSSSQQSQVASSSYGAQTDDDSSDGEVIEPTFVPQKRSRRVVEQEDQQNTELWRHSVENVNKFSQAGYNLETLRKTPLEEYSTMNLSTHHGFSSTVLHIPDSTEAMLTAINSSKDEIFSKQSTMTREIDLDVPANTIVKLKINMIVKR